jgi:hypothetical protein
VQRGFVVFWAFVWQSGWFLILLPILLVLIWPDAPSLLLAALFVGQAAYSIYVGGDAWEHKGGANRFIAIAMPLFFVLFMRTLEKIRAALIAGRKGAWWPLASQTVLALFVLASLFSFNVINENDPTAQWTLLKRPPFVAGTERYVRLGLLIKEITTPEARIAVATAGNIIYFAEREGIDMLGKSDRVIAHSQPHENSGSLSNVDEIFRPGHNKWDYQHSIVDLHPDIVAQIWGSSKEMDPYLTAGGFEYFLLDGYPLYIRVDSENIDWDAVDTHLEAAE